MLNLDAERRAAAVIDAALAKARAAHPAPLGPDVARLSRLFTTERSARAGGYLQEPALRRAYVGFFVPNNAVKIAALLARFGDEGLLQGMRRDAPRILDLGAGPLTGILGAGIAFGALGPSVAVDLAERAMEDGEALVAKALGPVPLTRSVASVSGPVARWNVREPVDLVIAANVMNELGDPRRAIEERMAIVERAIELLAPGGRVLIVDPGTRVHGRALMALRDALVASSKKVAVLAPCRGAARCPLLATDGDWCHGEIAWNRPKAFAEVERAAGIDKSMLKESHLLLARAGEAAQPTTGARLVGGLMRGRDDVERRYACARTGLITLGGNPRLPRPLAEPPRGALAVEVPTALVVDDARRPRDAPHRDARRDGPRGRDDDRRAPRQERGRRDKPRR